MKNSKKYDEYIANLLYDVAIQEEKEWRKECHLYDIKLIDEILNYAKKAGYNYKYFTDITHRDNTNKEFLMFLLNYIGCFQDDYFSAELVKVVGKKGNTFSTDMILKSYMELSKDAKMKFAIFYDNALYQIKDRRYVLTYIELLKLPEEAINLPLTMIMLGKWKLEDAKPYFLDYLNLCQNTTELVYISLEALSYYNDSDGSILKALESISYTDNRDLQKAIKKSINRLTKNISIKQEK